MGKVELRYIKAFKDRHGKPRHYFRRPGFRSIALPGLPGSVEFMEAYKLALVGKTAPARQIGEERTKPGSISALFVAYYSSADFQALHKDTKRSYRCVLEPFRAKFGSAPVTDIKPEGLRKVMDGMRERPGAANNLRKRLRTVLAFAVDRGWIDVNPALVIRKPKYKSLGFPGWSEEQITAYEAKWPSGTRERRAFALLLYTGQRRGDAAVMGRQHVRAGRISVVQQKTGARLDIRIHPELQRELDLAPADELTFITTEAGKPYTKESFSAWFVETVKAAGVEGRTAHGLRKSAARRLAEAGCSAHQIASITGHRSLQEVEHYTRDVNQKRLGDEAIDRLVEAEKGTGIV